MTSLPTRRPFFKGSLAAGALSLLPARDASVAVHCRANGPTFLYHAGQEAPLGAGRVDFPRFMKRLAETAYRGPIIIERENAGASFPAEVRKARRYLEKLMEQP